MSAYRTNYTPEPGPRRARRRPLIAGGSLVIALTLATWLLVAVLMHTGEPAAVTPVRTPDVQISPIEPLDATRLARIRAEAFRAGFAAAAQAGCTGALSSPIAGVKP